MKRSIANLIIKLPFSTGTVRNHAFINHRVSILALQISTCGLDMKEVSKGDIVCIRLEDFDAIRSPVMKRIIVFFIHPLGRTIYLTRLKEPETEPIRLLTCWLTWQRSVDCGHGDWFSLVLLVLVLVGFEFSWYSNQVSWFWFADRLVFQKTKLKEMSTIHEEAASIVTSLIHLVSDEILDTMTADDLREFAAMLPNPNPTPARFAWHRSSFQVHSDVDKTIKRVKRKSNCLPFFLCQKRLKLLKRMRWIGCVIDHTVP